MPTPTFRKLSIFLAVVADVALFGSLAALAGSPRHVNYSRDIRPILSNSCYKCHGPDAAERKAGLRFDNKAGAYAKLESGDRAIVPGSASKSALIQRVTSHDPDVKMPPPDSGKTVTAEQIELIKAWIDEGAEFHPHWSFVPPKHAPAPEIKSPQGALNPIDRFIIGRLEEEGLAPSPAADKTTLIRRATLDLTGLPPTISEVDAFLADQSPNAYERLVDRLLASPQYGEQMTRDWLDAARYGDTHGLHLDNERSIWPYRDWLIRSFNSNKPFDQFAVEQLAGDLLPNATVDTRVATGFNRCNVTTGEGGAIDEEFYVRYAVDRVQTTGTVFLGLTLGCCVCHDHKFDPITQKEFYRMFGYFGSLAERPMDGNALLPPPAIRVASTAEARNIERLKRGASEAETAIRAALRSFRYKEPAIDARVAATGTGAVPPRSEDLRTHSLKAWEASVAKDKSALPRSAQRALDVEPKNRTSRQAKIVRDYFVENVFAGSRSVFEPLHAQLSAARQAVDAAEQLSPSTLVMQDMPKARDIYVLIRGAYDRKGEKVIPGVPAAIGPALPGDAPENRLALARWIVDTKNPLTARVIVNRFWQHYFGTGIVKTAEDFGAQGEWPTHPELLDWLARELEQSGWNVKRIQRLIVTSATYRQSARDSAALAQRDPENRLLARGPRFRMDAEMVRDTALAVGGLLVDDIGGRSVKPYQPPGLWEAIGYSGSNTVHFVQDHHEALYRRSMYTFWKRTSPPPALTTFDAPSREECVVRRSRTNTPLQALALMNDEQYVEAARHLAERMIRKGGRTPAERIEFGFRLATSRQPTADEVRVFQKLYDAQSAAYAKNEPAAAKLLGVGESPRDMSLDTRELAAWTMVANVLLNLDETVTKG
jgi:Protein of unknown function (DUF1553)/Protein of unknown function (DUF1549)/Planctomycete cytochrome C